jgi:hypothetical protein
MGGVYDELRGFICAHSRCARARHADLYPVAPEGYRLLLTCGCGVEFKRWVLLPKDANGDPLCSALPASLAALSSPRCGVPT